MQAPQSYTASGEHFPHGLPASSTLAAHAQMFGVDAPVHPSVYLSVGPDVHPNACPIPGLAGDVRMPGRSGRVPEYADAAGSADGIADGIGLAHDAGNLLGAIRLYCDLLALPGVLRSEHRHYAHELLQLTARSGSLIDRLLRPAGRPGEPDGAVRRAERIRLDEVVMGCRGTLAPIVAPGVLSIAVEAGATGEVAMPREAMERILVNLAKNAAEAVTPEQGRGTVAVRVRAVTDWGPERAEGIALSVEDRGRGMDETALGAAISGHGVSPHGDEERPGRGLGLRVVRELAARAGGELRIRSRVGHGTTVEIVWPTLPPAGTETG